MDEMGRPLYGDVFGVDLQDVGTAMDEEEIDKSLWGELESEEEEEEEEEEVRWNETKHLLLNNGFHELLKFYCIHACTAACAIYMAIMNQSKAQSNSAYRLYYCTWC